MNQTKTDGRADHGLISLTAIPFWVALGGFGWLGAAAEASKASRESRILLDSVGQVPRKTRTHENRCAYASCIDAIATVLPLELPGWRIDAPSAARRAARFAA